MSKVAKIIIIDNSSKYLLMYRSDHPTYGQDPDLPGGTLETGEVPLEGMLREVYEEAGLMIDSTRVKKLYEGADYSDHATSYTLYAVQLDNRPEVVMSWEHSAYEWLERTDFLKKAKNANDTYMHMVHDVVTQEA